MCVRAGKEELRGDPRAPALWYISERSAYGFAR
jgi:hypothetical protein